MAENLWDGRFRLCGCTVPYRHRSSSRLCLSIGLVWSVRDIRLAAEAES